MGLLFGLRSGTSKKHKIGSVIFESRHNQQFQLIFKEKSDLRGGVLLEAPDKHTYIHTYPVFARRINIDRRQLIRNTPYRGPQAYMYVGNPRRLCQLEIDKPNLS